MENSERSCTAGGNVKWHGHLEHSPAVPQNVTHETYDAAVPLLLYA